MVSFSIALNSSSLISTSRIDVKQQHHNRSTIGIPCTNCRLAFSLSDWKCVCLHHTNGKFIMKLSTNRKFHSMISQRKFLFSTTLTVSIFSSLFYCFNPVSLCQNVTMFSSRWINICTTVFVVAANERCCCCCCWLIMMSQIRLHTKPHAFIYIREHI